jgi:hypothetical protein
MRMIVLGAVALALSACGGGSETTANDDNVLTADNMMAGDNMMLDANASVNATGGMDANASTNAATENMMAKDAATHDADTNLANGL